MRTQLVWPLRPTHLILLAALASACGGGGTAPEPPPPPEPLQCLAIADEITFFRGPASNEWNDVLVDSQQRVWLAGYADGQLGQNIEPSGNSRAVLRQLARDGSLQWESGAEFDTPGTDVAEALALDAQGRALAAGRTTGSFPGHVNAGQFDTFVAWNGGAGWRVHQNGTERPQRPRQLSVAPDGDILVAGYDDVYIPTNFVEAWADPFVQRLAWLDTGQPGERLQARWTHQFVSSADDQADAQALDPVARGSASYVAGAVNTGAERGMFLRKLGADGGVLWNVRPAANLFGHIAAVIAQADGTLLVGGSVFGSVHGALPIGAQDVFVARIDAADGRVLQAWQFGTVDSERLADMKLDADGNILLLGETLGAVVPGQPKAGEVDLFMMKLSPTGQLLAARQWGTADDEGARRLAVDACGRVLAVGYSAANGRRAGVMWFWRPAV